MQADLPFYDCPEDALRAAVQALGGAKQVGARLWPDKSPDTAGNRMLDCLNPSRSEKLELSQMMAVLAWAKDVGFHAPMQWICGEIGYEARAVTKDEAIDRVTSVIESTARTLGTALTTLERLQRARAVA